MAHDPLKARILVVDGNPTSRRLLAFLLMDEGHDVVPVEGLEGARRALQNGSEPIHLVLLDCQTSGPDWMSLAKDLQRQARYIPLILLSDERDVESRVAGLEIGADDYISKPFDPSELLARVAAISRRIRASATGEEVLRSGSLELAPSLLKVKDASGKEAGLTPTEARLLALLMRNADRVLPRKVIVSQVWGREAAGNNLEVYIRRIRKKVELDPDHPLHILTVTGVGYVFRAG